MPSQADDHDARARWLATGETSEQRAEGAFRAGWPPGMTRLPMLVLEGSWSETREIAQNMIQHQPAVLVMLAEVAYGQGDAETVGHHPPPVHDLTSIYAKLAVNSGAAVTRFAVENGLT